MPPRPRFARVVHMTVDADRRLLTPRLGVLEAALSVVSVGLIAFLPLHYIGAHLCFFGECSQPGPDEIRTYRLVVAALVVTVGATLAVAFRRRARWAFAWHGMVAVTGVAVAVVFAMPTIVDLTGDPRDPARDDPPTPIPGNVPCHSGPPDDCPGG